MGDGCLIGKHLTEIFARYNNDKKSVCEWTQKNINFNESINKVKQLTLTLCHNFLTQ